MRRVATASGATDGDEPRAIALRPVTETGSADDIRRRLEQAPADALREQLLAGGAYGLVMALVHSALAEGGLLPVRVVLLTVIYAWPGVFLHLSLHGRTSRRLSRRLLIGYLAALVLMAVLALIRSSELTVGQLIFLWCYSNLPATFLGLLFLNRRIRAVGPLVLTLMIACITGSVVILGLAGSSERALRAAAETGGALGMNASGVFVSIVAIGFGLFGVIGWGLLRLIDRGHRAKRINDLSLQANALLLLFALTHSVGLAFEGAIWLLGGLLAFVAWHFTLAAVQRRHGAREAAPVGLLLLRVFSLGRRSEALFDALTLRWRRVGPVQLIAGPDLLTTTIEPHEMLDFASGRLARQFSVTREDVDARSEALDYAPDRDGRYRVNELFCRDDTWRWALEALIDHSDVVLLDLRSFGPSNSGCTYEIETLLQFVPMTRVVLLADETTDRAYLEHILEETASALGPASPNSGLQIQEPLVVDVLEDGSLSLLQDALCAAAVPATVG
jgi:hypothetical protein